MEQLVIGPVNNDVIEDLKRASLGPYSFYLFTSGRLNPAEIPRGAPPKGKSGPKGGRPPSRKTTKQMQKLLTAPSTSDTYYEQRVVRRLAEAEEAEEAEGDVFVVSGRELRKRTKLFDN